MRFKAKIWKTQPDGGSKVLTVPAAHEAQAGREYWVTLEEVEE